MGSRVLLARGFYDRLPRLAPRRRGLPSRIAPRCAPSLAGTSLCPYYLSQELARWADVVVADYNYYFDQSALLYGLTVANQWKVAVLVDEAHNLVERARGMFSTRLDRTTLVAAQRRAPAPIKHSVTKVLRLWDDLFDGQQEPYCVYDEIPVPLLRALEGAAASVADFLAQSPLGVAEELLDFYFRALQAMPSGRRSWIGTPSAMPRSSCSRSGTRSRSRRPSLRNAIPAGFLAPRWAAAHCCVLFSATLTPFDFYRDILGLPRDCART